jgi:hypothetical protein
MRLLIRAIVFLVILGSPILAAAQSREFIRHRHQPPVQAPPSAPTPVPSNGTGMTTGGWCINYGYQPLVNGQYDMAQVHSDLSYLKAHNYNCLRLAFYGQNSDVSKSLALAAKANGFYVIIGNDGDPMQAGYNTGVIAEATWAQQNGIDQISIGNEASKDLATQQKLAADSCAVRAVYSGIISYDTYKAPQGFDDIKAWAQNRGCLDLLGINLYSDYANTAAELQNLLSAHWYVSETNVDCDYNNQCGDDSSWASGLQKILGILTPYGVPINIFSFNAGGDGVASHWGIIGHPAVMNVVGL